MLRKAFLSRFPVIIDMAPFRFDCVGNPKLGDQQHARLVFKIRADDADEERVLLKILNEVVSTSWRGRMWVRGDAIWVRGDANLSPRKSATRRSTKNSWTRPAPRCCRTA